jgi:hypothetical protein
MAIVFVETLDKVVLYLRDLGPEDPEYISDVR